MLETESEFLPLDDLCVCVCVRERQREREREKERGREGGEKKKRNTTLDLVTFDD